MPRNFVLKKSGRKLNFWWHEDQCHSATWARHFHSLLWHVVIHPAGEQSWNSRRPAVQIPNCFASLCEYDAWCVNAWELILTIAVIIHTSHGVSCLAPRGIQWKRPAEKPGLSQRAGLMAVHFWHWRGGDWRRCPTWRRNGLDSRSSTCESCIWTERWKGRPWDGGALGSPWVSRLWGSLSEPHNPTVAEECQEGLFSWVADGQCVDATLEGSFVSSSWHYVLQKNYWEREGLELGAQTDGKRP